MIESSERADPRPTLSERVALISDFAKHVTTLTTASILLVAAFFDKLDSRSGPSWALIAALIAFAAATVAGLFGQGYAIERLFGTKPRNADLTGRALHTALALFVLGLGFLIGFLLASRPTPPPQPSP